MNASRRPIHLWQAALMFRQGRIEHPLTVLTNKRTFSEDPKL